MSALNLFDVAAQRASSTPRPSTTKRGKRIAFNVYEGDDVRTINPAGRDAWALGELIHAAADGCTPLTHVGPRWSAYVFKLKRIYGLDIATLHEEHGGPYSGTHARYVLQQRVEFADEEPAPDPTPRTEPSHTIGMVAP